MLWVSWGVHPSLLIHPVPLDGVLSEKDQEAARWAAQFIAALDNKAPEIILADGLDSYHRLPATYCPGVSAIETLLLTVQRGPHQLDHFLETAELPRVLALLEVKLPLR